MFDPKSETVWLAGTGAEDNSCSGVLNWIDQLREGAFRPFWEQPLATAVLLPLGSLCWSAVTELVKPLIEDVLLAHL